MRVLFSFIALMTTGTRAFSQLGIRRAHLSAGPACRGSHTGLSGPHKPLAASAAPKVQATPNAVFASEDILDEEAMLAASTFPIKPPELIARAKQVLVTAGVGTKDASVLADNFEFCAPFIGPLVKEEYLGALGNFRIEDAFPDVGNRWHGFRVDPFQPNRVWFNSRVCATHTGESPAFGPATGKALEFPPQSFSLIFNEAGLVTEFTVGYPIDRRIGNTGGIGGAFGFFYGVGRPLPFPECKPYKPSLQLRLLGFVSRVGKIMKGLFSRKDRAAASA